MPTVVMLSTGGISPPPRSVESLIFLQAENKIVKVATMAVKEIAKYLFLTK
jgi:hypothetical protein